MVEKIKQQFNTIPKSVNPKPRLDFTVPDHEEKRFIVATDKEATQSTIQVLTLLPKPDIDKNSDAYWKSGLVNSFFNSMINARISELMNQKQPPFMGASIAYTGMLRNHNGYYCYAVANGDDETNALKAIMTEHVRIERHGFQKSELDRVKAELLASMASTYKQKDKIGNESYISSMKSNFISGVPIVDYDSYYQFVQKIVPEITVEDLNNAFKQWNTKKNMSVVITGPDDVIHLTEEEIDGIFNVVNSNNSILPFEDDVVGKDLFDDKVLKGSKIKSEKSVDLFDATEFILDNNIKVVYRKADYEKDQVSLYAYSEGGVSLYDVKDLPCADNAGVFAGAYGMGEFDNIMLGKMLSGKMASCSASIGSTEETVSGGSTPQDVETMFQLMYMRFVQPRVDKEVYEKMIAQNYDIIEQNIKNPSVIIQDSIDRIIANYHPRNMRFSKEYLDQVDMDKMNEIYKERFANAADFTFFIVGNIEKEELKPLIEKYIGSLPTNSKFEKWKDTGVRSPRGYVKKRIEVELETPKSFVVNSLTKRMPYNIKDTYLNSILGSILDLRYTTNIRGRNRQK